MWLGLSSARVGQHTKRDSVDLVTAAGRDYEARVLGLS